jgi:DNA-binding winged helix-turn-helix (wHTH) protein
MRVEVLFSHQVATSYMCRRGHVIRSRQPSAGISSMASQTPETFRFGEFELNVDAGELRRSNRRLKLQPQPFKLLVLLVRRAGNLVSREDIRRELWPDGTFVDFDQSVNYSIKQIRDVLGDSADRPLYLETVPRRGHRFIAPTVSGHEPHRAAVILPGATGIRLEKALWTNIAELRMAESRRRRNTAIAVGVLGLVFLGVALFFLLR